MLKKLLFICVLTLKCDAQWSLKRNNFHKLVQIIAWKQLKYEIDGVYYEVDSNVERKAGSFLFNEEELEESEKFFVQYNNVPVGIEVDAVRNRAFVTVPRRRFGIPSTLNYIDLNGGADPVLKPYPSMQANRDFVSVYRPRVDVCGRLWAVDTGLLEVPDNRQQLKPPSIIIFDLRTDRLILRQEIESALLVSNRTTGGLTSITVDVTRDSCEDAHAYINDLATNTMLVFSYKRKSLWRFQHPSFSHDAGATDFNIGDHNIPWTDGLFSIALSEADGGRRTAYYHPFVATQEFSIPTDVLKDRNGNFTKNFKLEGVRGVYSQSGSHDYHSGTKTLLFANVAQNAIACWGLESPLRSNNVALVAQDRTLLLYISDLKVVGDDVWILVNQMSRFVYSKLDYRDTNFFIYKGKVQELISGTICENKQRNK